MDLRAPFPWFGGKSRVAHLVWDAFGDVANYVEPFAGSLAVLLGRPSDPRIETVNDLDAYLSNFWRAVAADPEAVAHHADWPVNEADLHARHLWLVNQAEFRERMLSDPDFYDVKIAGWWVWGLSAWLGSGWCDIPANEDAGGGSGQRGRSPTPAAEAFTVATTALPQQRRNGCQPSPPKSSDPVRRQLGPRSPSRQLPWVGGGGRGVHRQTITAASGVVLEQGDSLFGLRREL